jgi:hypothetical protein
MVKYIRNKWFYIRVHTYLTDQYAADDGSCHVHTVQYVVKHAAFSKDSTRNSLLYVFFYCKKNILHTWSLRYRVYMIATFTIFQQQKLGIM